MAGSRHILIYGPPAAGKLTVARYLATGYGLKLLDNHLTADVAGRVFEFGTEPFGALVQALRWELYRTAAAAGLDVVSTLVYDHATDRLYVDQVVDIFEAEGGRVTFAQLLPPPAVLEKRVTEPSRAECDKIRDVTALQHVLASWDLRTPVNADDLSIDNSDIPPETVAAMIAERAGLRPVPGEAG